MARFKTNYEIGEIEIPTSSLPDIVFMLLFFFMVTTVLRTEEKKVKYKVPTAEEIKKIERKSLVTEIVIGWPENTVLLGKEPVIQSGDALLRIDQLPQFIIQAKSKIPESQQSQHIVLLKVDKAIKMGIVTDVQQELKKANARKIVYATLTNKKSQL